MTNTKTGPLARTARPVYDRLVRPHLPRKWGVLNGVHVRSFALLTQTEQAFQKINRATNR